MAYDQELATGTARLGIVTQDHAMEPSLPSLPAAPDLLAPVSGFRDWKVTPEGLCSPRTGVMWQERVLRAECRPLTADDFVRPPHRAPGHECGCGIHAYYAPSDETSKVSYTGVSGIVTVWGDVEAHADGLRAEFARVEALGVYTRWSERQKSAVARVAECLEAELVDLYDLADAAPSYAPPMPQQLIPGVHRRREPIWRRRRRHGRLVIAES
jgi:hypothetical protein